MCGEPLLGASRRELSKLGGKALQAIDTTLLRCLLYIVVAGDRETGRERHEEDRDE